ncbi:hypothetical protein BU17DRAFT_50632 [Hysterangium stoloniferum]|nr:hypothetical protein BU17DRAFT_50632 [Hysterangium stoloniferum]
MHKMGHHWKKEPKGQYKDGHEHNVVVAYHQNIFLPFVATLCLHMCQWFQNGTLKNDPQRS